MLGDRSHVLLAIRDGEIIGFTQFFAWNRVLYGRVRGLDDAIARAAARYYNLTSYHAIELAASLGCTALDLGCDSYEAKVRRGARLEPLWGLVLDAPWPPGTVAALRERERDRRAELAAWDPALASPSPQ